MPLTVLKTIFTVKEIIFRLLPRCYVVYIYIHNIYPTQFFDSLKQNGQDVNKKCPLHIHSR